MADNQDNRHEWLRRFKQRLGIFCVPLGIFFLLVTFILIITPLTPGSMLTFFIGLELLNIREKFFIRVEKWRQKWSSRS